MEFTGVDSTGPYRQKEIDQGSSKMQNEALLKKVQLHLMMANENRWNFMKNFRKLGPSE